MFACTVFARLLRVSLLGLLLAGLVGGAWAQHFDVELRTDKGPVAGSRIETDFYGDLGLAGQLPIDGLTGYRLFPAYFGDFPGGKYATANPGFQAFTGWFAPGEQIHFRALGRLQHWSPASGKWGTAPAGVKITLFGGIPPEVVLGYSTNPAQWADQYAYYAAGTRFDSQGIAGPLTALIDETKTGGTFHSHLDWKISASSGTPPVGAYLVTLELWSPVLVAGQPKYLASQPFHVIFEAGINTQQMQQAFAARINPPCAGQTLSWSVGEASCAATAEEAASGTTINLEDAVAPATGSARFSCSSGRWGSPSQASCSLPPPPACPAQALSWTVDGQSCSAAAQRTESGQSVLLSDSLAPAVGEARFSCLAGQWSAPSQSRCAVPPPPVCAAQQLSWSVGGVSCTGAAGATNSGSSVQVEDRQAPTTGEARFECRSGQWSAPSAASCALPPPAACTAQSLSWTVDGHSCSASAAAAPSGAEQQLFDQTGPSVGDASFSCQDGRWSAPLRARCAPQVLAACPAQAVSWTEAGASCSAHLLAAASGATQTALDSVAPTTGQASYLCSDGRWSAAGTAPRCSEAPPPACPSRLLSWDLGGLVCSAVLPETASGSSRVAVDSQEPLTGSARFACQQGQWSGASDASCQAPAPKPCAAQALSWVQAGERCEATALASPSGSQLQLLDGLLPNTGSASFRCTDGRWSEAAEALCQPPPVKPLPPARAPTSPWTPSVQLPWERPRR